MVYNKINAHEIIYDSYGLELGSTMIKNVELKALLDKHAPEKKYVRVNEANSMDTELNHAIMVQLEFHYKFPRKRSNNTRLNEVLKMF